MGERTVTELVEETGLGRREVVATGGGTMCFDVMRETMARLPRSYQPSFINSRIGGFKRPEPRLASYSMLSSAPPGRVVVSGRFMAS